MQIRIHGVTRGTEVNGPGKRNIVHLQGCSIGCPGCFNRPTWDHGGGGLRDVEELARELLEDQPDGVSISGGEPMEQAENLLHLLANIRHIDPNISTLMYTGFTRQRLERSVWWRPLKELLDVVVAGPYRQDLPAQSGGLVSSTNQELLLLSRHTIRELMPAHQVEMVINTDGTIIMMGFPSQQLISSMEAL